MKRYVKKEVEVETTTEIGDIVGFETSDARKGTLVYVGLTGNLHAIVCDGIVCDGCGFNTPNSSCGDISENKYLSVEDFINRHAEVFSKHGISVTIDSFFFFDTAKELYRWLSE